MTIGRISSTVRLDVLTLVSNAVVAPTFLPVEAWAAFKPCYAASALAFRIEEIFVQAAVYERLFDCLAVGDEDEGGGDFGTFAAGARDAEFVFETGNFP